MGILDGMMNFNDPNSMAMLGLASGIASAARPSRLPTPLGAAMAEGYQSAMQFRQAAQQQQLLQQEVQQRGMANALSMAQLKANIQTFPELYGNLDLSGIPGMGGQQPQQPRQFTPSILAGNPAPAASPAGGGAPNNSMVSGNPAPASGPISGGVSSNSMLSGLPAGGSGAAAAPQFGASSSVPTATAQPNQGNALFSHDMMLNIKRAQFLGMPNDVIAKRIPAPPEAQSTIQYALSLPSGPEKTMAMQAAAKAIGLPPGYRIGVGGMEMDPNYLRSETALAVGKAGAEAWAKVAPTIAEKNAEPYTLSRPGAGRFINGQLVAQNPVPLEGVDASGTPYRTYSFMPTSPNAPPIATRPGVPGAAPVSGDSRTPTPSGRVAEDVPPAPQSNGFNPSMLGGFNPGSAVLPSGRTANSVVPPVSAGSPLSGLNGQGLPTIQTGLNPLQKSSMETRGAGLEKYGDTLDANATAANQNNFLVDQMRRESQTWEMGKFADHIQDAKAYVSAFGHQFGIDTSGYDKSVGDYQSYVKNSMELVRAATRATSSRAAVQEMQMIQQALPSATMTRQGFSQIADQLQSVNDFHIAKQQAAQMWRGQQGNTLDGFESSWNNALSPAAFWIYRMPADQWQTVSAQMAKTPEGRASVARIMQEMQGAKAAGLLPDLGYGAPQ